jgi:uncharacterized protein (DUF1697 family)
VCRVVATHAAFLRAVNLGPTRKISSAQLRDCFESMGFEDVATFRTSGNVVFGAGREPAAKLRARVEKGLAKTAGFDVVVFLRTAAQIRAIAGAKPFPDKQVAASKGKLQVNLLEKAPPAPAKRKVLALATDDDRLAFSGSELYWLPSGGQMESELDHRAIDELVGPSTRRTMGTIELMASKFFPA